MDTTNDFAKALESALPQKPTMTPSPKLVWLDLETTGLDPKQGSILEIGVVITDLNLVEADRKAWILPYDRDVVLPSMNDYVLNMHMANGLLRDVWAKQGEGETLYTFHQRLDDERRKIGRSIEQWIRKTCSFEKSKHLYLAGSSIHFDRGWLAVHFPGILETVSHRMVDVSTFKAAFPGLLTQPMFEAQVKAQHRALADLDYSIDQLQQMREKLGL